MTDRLHPDGVMIDFGAPGPLTIRGGQFGNGRQPIAPKLAMLSASRGRVKRSNATGGNSSTNAGITRGKWRESQLLLRGTRARRGYSTR